MSGGAPGFFRSSGNDRNSTRGNPNRNSLFGVICGASTRGNHGRQDSSLRKTLVVATAVEAAFFAWAIATRGDFHHYTWWALTTYFVFLVAFVAGQSQRIWVFCAGIQSAVIAGVIAMSFIQCGTLVNAAKENGSAVYIAGNFAMHYWPTIGIVARATKPISHINQCILSLTLFLAYTGIEKPNNVYGCPVPYNAVVAGGTAAGLAFTGLVCSHDFVVRKWDAF